MENMKKSKRLKLQQLSAEWAKVVFIYIWMAKIEQSLQK